MKRYFLLYLCTLIAVVATAQTTYTYSGTSTTLTVSADGKTATLNVATAGDFASWYNTISSSSEAPNTATLNGVTTKLTVTGNVNGDDLGKINAFPAAFVDLSALTTTTGLALNSSTKGLKLPVETDLASFSAGSLTYYYTLDNTNVAKLYVTGWGGGLSAALTNATELKSVYSLKINSTGSFNADDITAINATGVTISVLEFSGTNYTTVSITNTNVKFLNTGSSTYITTSRTSGISVAKITTNGYEITAYNGTPGGDLTDILTGYEALNPYKLSVEGELDEADFGTLIKCAAHRLNIEKATVATGTDPTKLSFEGVENDSIEYAILTQGLASILPDWASHFPNLKSAISYTLPTDATTFDASILGYVKVAGTLHDVVSVSGLYSSMPQLGSVTLSGNLKACDIANTKENINSNGHIYELDETGTAITTGIDPFTGVTGLSGQYNGPYKIKTIDFTNAVFERQRDMNIAKIVSSNVTSVKLPTSTAMDSIPSYCFNNCKSLTAICIPYNYEYLCDHCFYDDNPLIKITTTKKDSTEEYGHGDNTYTFSENLKYIGTQAFYNDNLISDVYCMATTAPKCELNAFDGATLYGNNSFTNSHPIQKTSYTANSNHYAVLHYPSDASADEAKHYTDVTRKYSIYDETQATDGNGKVLVWPTQVEFNRSIAQANTGYIWDDWTLSPLYSATGGATTTESLAAETNADVVKKSTSYDQTTYGGWHQFTLASSYSYSDNPQWDFSKIYDNNWWTICVPFDLTKSELLTIFGHDTTYPEVCTLKAVTRNSSTEVITLDFGKDLVAAKADDDIVITKDLAYMIKPQMDPAVLGNNFKAADHVFSYNNTTIAGAFDFPVNTDVTATDQNGSTTDWVYTFRGTFVDNYMPAYAFYLGWDNTANSVAFYYQGANASTKKKWNSFTSIVGAKLTATHVDHSGSITGNNYVPEHYDIACTDDVVFTAGGSAKADIVFGDGSTPTVINGVEIDNAAAGKVTGKVYNLNGQQVDANGSLNNLGKGIYIMNGKKYIVK